MTVLLKYRRYDVFGIVRNRKTSPMPLSYFHSNWCTVENATGRIIKIKRQKRNIRHRHCVFISWGTKYSSMALYYFYLIFTWHRGNSTASRNIRHWQWLSMPFQNCVALAKSLQSDEMFVTGPILFDNEKLCGSERVNDIHDIQKLAHYLRRFMLCIGLSSLNSKIRM